MSLVQYSPNRIKQKKAQSTVEFALCLPVFVMMVFGVVDLNRYSLQAQSMDRLLRATARFAVTGRVIQTDPSDANTKLDRRASIIKMAEVSNPTPNIIAVDADGDDATFSMTPNDGGEPSDRLTLTITSEFSFVTPLIEGFLGRDGESFNIFKQMTVINEQGFSLTNPEVLFIN
ncbi:MAG: TadE/TadG family type IV pilus assembly protein [Verrucomicrobiota bacterium]